MIRVAIKMLMGDKLKYFGLIAGMAFAAMMIAQQASIGVGLARQTGSFIRSIPEVDLWVMDPQVRFSEDILPMSETALMRVRSVEGVEWALPMFKSWLPARLEDGTRLNMIVIGLDDTTLTGCPETIRGSREDLRREHGVLIHERLSKKNLRLETWDRDLNLGDRFSLNDHDAVIVGTYDGEPSFFWDPMIYTTYSRGLRYAPRMRNLLSFVILKVKPGADVEQIRRTINENTPFEAMTSSQFEITTMRFILEKTGILVNFGMAVGLGFVIGALVTGQTFFNFTLDNLRHFATLKAMGAGGWLLIRMISVQVLVAAGLSLGIGLGVAAGLGQLIRKTDLAFDMPWPVPVLTAAALILIALLAGGLSLVKVLRLEPGIVFRG